MFSIALKRASVFVLTLGLGLGLGGCAAEADTEEGVPGGEALGEVSSTLPLAAFSVAGATFAPLMSTGAGGAGSAGTGATNHFGTHTTLGGGLSTGSGTVGTGITTGSSFNTGPITTGSSFNTGPITTGSSFNTGPVTHSNAGGSTMNMSTGTGMAPVISTCLGADCL